MSIHGTKPDPTKHHPVLDIDFWDREFPLGDQRMLSNEVGTPEELALAEQARRLARSHGSLGPSVPADVFVWASKGNPEKPWLTRIGGEPWRDKNKPWPKDSQGVPLTFLGQICFLDSMDIVPFALPGEVALFFGTSTAGWITPNVGVIEWSNRDIPDRFGADIPWTGLLPMELHGVIHRTVQYTKHQLTEAPFQRAGFKQGGFGIDSIQSTLISAHASCPQRWPFGEGESLVAMLSSFYFNRRWPLCDVPRGLMAVNEDGKEYESGLASAFNFGIGGSGCIWIGRNQDGEFTMDSADS
jgi:hypothetical protein